MNMNMSIHILQLFFLRFYISLLFFFYSFNAAFFDPLKLVRLEHIEVLQGWEEKKTEAKINKYAKSWRREKKMKRVRKILQNIRN